MKQDKLISLIIPVHNEAENLKWHHKKIINFLKSKKIKYELIYVNDGSTDQSLSIVREFCNIPSVRYISFSRNFGKEAATTAGLRKAKGDAAILIDSDGQHPIELVPVFIAEWQKGHKQVIGVRSNDGEKRIIKRFGSRLFYAILRVIGADDSSQHGLTDFRLIDRQIIDEYNRLLEHNRVTRNLLDWLGFSRKLVPFEAQKRHAGKASYSFRKLFKLAIDGIVKHSTRPLKFIGLVGVLISLISPLAGIILLVEKFVFGDPARLSITTSGYLALFLSFMVGIVLVCQGLLALYLETVFYETQNRPLFIIAEEG